MGALLKAWMAVCAVAIALRASISYAIKGPARPTWTFRFTVWLAVIRYFVNKKQKTEPPPEETTQDDLVRRSQLYRDSLDRIAAKPLDTIEQEVRAFVLNREKFVPAAKPLPRLNTANGVKVLTVEPVITISRLDELIMDAAQSAELNPFHPDSRRHLLASANDPPSTAEWVYTGENSIKNCATTTGPIVMYIHGGGYVAMSAAVTRSLIAGVCVELATPCFSVNYRLAPERPYPCALLDVVAAYVHLLREGLDARRIVFMGDSAGGGLALCSLVFLRDFRAKLSLALDMPIPMPGAAVLFSPWLDLSLTLPSITLNDGLDALASPSPSRINPGYYYAGGLYTVDAYANAEELKRLQQFTIGNPYISPARAADLSHGLPPILTQCGGSELLLSDALAAFYAAADPGDENEAKKLAWVTDVTKMVTAAHPAFQTSDQFVPVTKQIWQMTHFRREVDRRLTMTVEIYRDMVHVIPAYPFIKEFFVGMHRMSEWVGRALQGADTVGDGAVVYVDVHGTISTAAGPR